MQVTTARQGRVWMLRLEKGDTLPDCLESLARQQHISHGLCFYLGGAEHGSRLVVGPEDGKAAQIEAQQIRLQGVHEALAVGTIALDEHDQPIVHMHGAFGRGESVRCGCVRPGVDVWLVGEVVVIELVECSARRRFDADSGFSLLRIEDCDTDVSPT